MKSLCPLALALVLGLAQTGPAEAQHARTRPTTPTGSAGGSETKGDALGWLFPVVVVGGTIFLVSSALLRAVSVLRRFGDQGQPARPVGPGAGQQREHHPGGQQPPQAVNDQQATESNRHRSKARKRRPVPGRSS